MAGAAVAVAGTLVGLATFGASAVIAAPALVAGGIVVGVKGHKLKKEAMRNREKAVELENKIYTELPNLTSALG